MTSRRFLPLLVAAAVTLASTLAGCGGGKKAAPLGVLGKDIKPLSVSVPSQVLGLRVVPEDVSKALTQGGRSYVEASAVYSFRKDQLLEATLQISRLSDTKEVSSDKFHQELINSIGSSAPQHVRLSDTDVYLTTGNQQQLDVWFHDRYLFILAIRGDFDQPRSLLRQALEFAP